MPLFSSSTPFDNDVEKITNERNTSEDWGLIMDLCDRVSAARDGPKDCLRAVTKRLHHQDPHVVMQAIVLLDACVNNCGKPFKLEVASRDFEQDFKKLLSRSHPKVKEKLKAMLKKWAEQDFKGDPQLNLIPSLYQLLRREGEDFSASSDQQRRKQQVPKDPNVVSSQQEEDDIAKAIQLSLQQQGGRTNGGGKTNSTPAAAAAGGGGGLYGNLQQAVANAGNNGTNGKSESSSEPKKARALYDFEAAEDNELTFTAGEIVIILDDSDANWWKGSNHRGEGLFPSNFVSKDLDAPKEEKEKRRRSVQFNEEVEVKTLNDQNSPSHGQQQAQQQHPGFGPLQIDEAQIDRVLSLLNDSDPTSGEGDDPALVPLEQHVNAMGPLIDNELEKVDRRLAQLTRLSTELVDALNLYHQLMKELPATAAAPMPMYGAMPQPGYQPQQPGYPQQQQMYPGYPSATPQGQASADPAAAYMWQQQQAAAAGYASMPPQGAQAPTVAMPQQGAPSQQQQPSQGAPPPASAAGYPGYPGAAGIPPQQQQPQALYTE